MFIMDKLMQAMSPHCLFHFNLQVKNILISIQTAISWEYQYNNAKLHKYLFKLVQLGGKARYIHENTY